MTDFSKLTDEEINKAVFKGLYPEIEVAWNPALECNTWWADCGVFNTINGIPNYCTNQQSDLTCHAQLQTSMDVLEICEMSVKYTSPPGRDLNDLYWVASGYARHPKCFQKSCAVSHKNIHRAICECFLEMHEAGHTFLRMEA